MWMTLAGVVTKHKNGRSSSCESDCAETAEGYVFSSCCDLSTNVCCVHGGLHEILSLFSKENLLDLYIFLNPEQFVWHKLWNMSARYATIQPVESVG